MTAPAASAANLLEARGVAQSFVSARLAAKSLPDFPGRVPATLAEAYAIQEAAIPLWPDEIAGWKVGRIPPDPSRPSPPERLSGPIFRKAVSTAIAGEVTPFDIITGGFGAVEAEFVFVMGKDAPADRMTWTQDDAADLVGALHVGVEIAGSPLASINVLGPTVVVSDFGNNAALILGPEIPNWRGRDPATLPCETFIEGKSVGRGSAASLEDGPLGSLVFLLELCAARGRPLKAGQYVATGQTSGIHDIVAGELARVAFGPFGEILCEARVAKPAKAGAK